MLRTQFSPLNIASLAVWLDAADVSRMAQNSDGTTAVTANADPVGYVSTLVGGNATQGTANNRPTWRTNVQNGLPVLRFDGSNDSLQIASVALQSFCSVFVAGKFTTGAPLLIEHSANANSNNGFYAYGDALYSFFIRRTSTWFGNAGSAWMGSAFAVAEWIHGGHPDAAVRKDGTAQTLTTNITPISDTSVTTALNICSRNQASAFSNGDLGELIIFNRRITDTEAGFVRRYLGRKWGITVA